MCLCVAAMDGGVACGVWGHLQFCVPFEVCVCGLVEGFEVSLGPEEATSWVCWMGACNVVCVSSHGVCLSVWRSSL